MYLLKKKFILNRYFLKIVLIKHTYAINIESIILKIKFNLKLTKKTSLNFTFFKFGLKIFNLNPS